MERAGRTREDEVVNESDAASVKRLKELIDELEGISLAIFKGRGYHRMVAAGCVQVAVTHLDQAVGSVELAARKDAEPA